MLNRLEAILDRNELKDFKEYVLLLTSQAQQFFLRNDLLYYFGVFCDQNDRGAAFREESTMVAFIRRIQELFIQDDRIVLLHRYEVARYRFYFLRFDGEYMEEIDSRTYLDIKDRYVMKGARNGTHLHMDILPFYDFSPSIRDTRSVGHGIRFLNRYMCSNIFSKPEEWNEKLFDFIKLHRYNGRQLLVNGNQIGSFRTFFAILEETVRWLQTKPKQTPFAEVEGALQERGIEVGWGNTVGRILETMQLLIDLLNEPTDAQLEQFISRVPMPLISKIAIISPHGWFGQTNVLGKPDTGGQVIYILDQVRALERHLLEEIRLTGLEVEPKILVVTRLIPEAGDTTCGEKREKIFETNNGWILRIPFRDKDFNVVRHWISRFKIWPYLEDFAEDAATELTSEFQGRPDLIIGNYSDGNLVATLLSDRFDVIQCTIAHALEKTKYLFSDMYWSDKEPDYHFSVQFTADMLSMNKSDFIITSTHQEIIGTEDTMGQYESYQIFTLPGLYQVVNGVNLFAPKFNVIPPGVEENLYFPYHVKDKRLESQTRHWEERLFHLASDDIFGRLSDPDKPSIFTMARFDKIKNITGLIEAFGHSQNLQTHFNLVFAAGTIHAEQSQDAEEQEEIHKAYRLIEHYALEDKIRWLPSISKLDTGEVYRIIADRRGVFVQPALFEAFGLTILEAMASGLPTFGPKFGGPLEIIEPGVSGILLNTSKPEFIAAGLEAFHEQCARQPDYWQTLSENGIRRVRENFNWRLYSRRLVNQTKLYGFWRYSVSGKEKVKLDRYCDFMYHFLIRERARRIQS
ncbi:MAG TPA: sucrose synthase [Desulfobacterales bacterium]